MYCWDKLKQVQLPQDGTPVATTNPILFNDEGSRPCVYGASGLICSPIEIDEYGTTSAPQLTNPTYLNIGKYVGCAVDLGEMKCWGINDNAPAYVRYTP